MSVFLSFCTCQGVLHPFMVQTLTLCFLSLKTLFFLSLRYQISGVAWVTWKLKNGRDRSQKSEWMITGQETCFHHEVDTFPKILMSERNKIEKNPQTALKWCSLKQGNNFGQYLLLVYLVHKPFSLHHFVRNLLYFISKCVNMRTDIFLPMIGSVIAMCIV